MKLNNKIIISSTGAELVEKSFFKRKLLKVSKKGLVLYIILSLIIGIILFTIWENNIIKISRYEYRNEKIPKSFKRMNIAQISDLHNRNFHGKLIRKLKVIKPDIIVITGDLIDRRRTNINVAMDTVSELKKIAPVYYVSGNHEQLSGYYRVLTTKLREENVIILDNGYKIINKNGEKIGILGIEDPSARKDKDNYLWDNCYEYLIDKYEDISHNINTNFNILLCHRPEKINAYDKMNVDLVFCGHAHGGQVRLPFIKGVIAPNQGFFPKYTKGMYIKGDTTMVVSAGLGNSVMPIRVFNPSEIVVVTLK